VEPRFIFSAGDAPKSVSTTVVALYDPASGRIHHVHTVHRHEGGEELSESAVIAQAQRHAKQLGHDVDHLNAKVSSRAEYGHVPHRIDLRTGAFVALETPVRQRKHVPGGTP
jgi:hypothetical protein